MLERIAQLHERLHLTIAATLVCLLIAGGILFLRQRPIGRYYQAGVAIVSLLILSEALLGLVLWLNREGELPVLHFVYAGLALAGLPSVWLYLRQDRRPQAALIYALACLTLLGIVLRSRQSGVILPAL